MEKKTKASKTQKTANCGYTVLTTVPYQLCPKCSGDGTVLVQNWNGGTTSISSGLQTCNLCGGAMIIPMHIVPTEYKILGKRQDGFNPSKGSIKVKDLTEEQAYEYAELMKQTFIEHWKSGGKK